MTYNKKIDYVFVAFPSFLAETDELTPADKAVFLYLMSCSHRSWNPSYKEFARKLSLGNTTIRKSIIKLHLLGFIVARTSIRGEALVNEINSYKVNLTSPDDWCPTLSLKEEIERCFEINNKPAPIFKLVYPDRKALNEDISTAIEKGHSIRRKTISPQNAQKLLEDNLPLKECIEFEELLSGARRANIWQACSLFSLWIQLKSSSLSPGQVIGFKTLFSEEIITSERWSRVKEALFTENHQRFLEVIAEEKEKRKKNDEKSI